MIVLTLGQTSSLFYSLEYEWNIPYCGFLENGMKDDMKELNGSSFNSDVFFYVLQK